MRHSEFMNRMWTEALDQLDRAERLQRQFFTPAETATRRVCWAPPVDVFEGADEFVVQVALPDVDPARVEYVLDDHVLVIAGERRLSPALAGAAIRRLEIPQGRFERRIAVPAHRVSKTVFDNGCLTLVLKK